MQKMTPKLVVLQLSKKIQFIEKNVFEKKMLSAYLFNIFKTMSRNFVKVNGSGYI